MSPMIRTPVSLVAFDLDGTLIRGDTVCQAIARAMGHLERMNELELLTRLDDIAAARTELGGYYASATKEQLLSYLERCKLAPGAEEGFALLRYHKVRTAIVSITWTFAVERFARKLGADYWVGTGLSEDGHIEHFWPEDKARWVRDLMRDLGLRREQVAAVGDSWGDVEMLRAVGHPFYVGESLPDGLEAMHVSHGDMLEVAQRVLWLETK
ncbi:MAG: HAD-IB family phosphatase [Chloroflexota bacterium]|nr:HAD-IB family phosphatase [Chloroflexota bacterium]